MTHQAIARKWRPQVFEDIVGQRHVTRTLQNAIRLGRVHHAFLMTGARGVGKTSAARVLARALNCEKGPATNPCNECGHCVEMLAGSFPDVLEIDAASHNSVDDIRDLVDKVRYTPQRGRYKIYVIDEVHMVTKQGFNALLKTLEEPPAHVIFILATTDPQQLLDTVISRCQRFDFKMIPVRTIFDHLKTVAQGEGVEVPDSSMMVIAREGGGSMRDAQSLLDQVLSFSGEAVSEEEVAEILGFIDRSILYDLLQAALQGDPGGTLETLSKVGTFGYDVRSFANQLLEAVRNVAVVRQVSDGARLLDLPDNEVARLQQLADGQAPEKLQRQFDILASAVDAITRSEQPMLLLEMAAVKMASVRDFVPVQSLIDRMEALERKLRKGGASAGPPPARRAAAPPPRRAPPAAETAPPTPTPTRPPETAPPTPTHPVETAPPTPPRPPEAAPPTPPRPAKTAPSPAPSNGGGDAVLGKLLSYRRGTPAALGEPPAAPTPTPKATPKATPAPPKPIAKAPPAPPKPARAKAKAKAKAPAPAAPAPKARPVAGELDPERADPEGSDLCDGTAWRRFAQALTQQEAVGPVCGALARAGFLGADEKTISIGFGSEIAARQMTNLGITDKLAAALAATFGEGTQLSWSVDVEARRGRSLAEELELLKAAKRAELTEASRTDPAVAAVLEAFPGAEIEGVKLPDNVEIDDVR